LRRGIVATVTILVPFVDVPHPVCLRQVALAPGDNRLQRVVALFAGESLAVRPFAQLNRALKALVYMSGVIDSIIC
jgi:hypothetical protein